MQLSQKDSVDIKGLSRFYPSNSKMFKQVKLEEKLRISHEMPDIRKISQINASYFINKVSPTSSIKASSIEGQVLTGMELKVGGEINLNMEYVTDNSEWALYSVNFILPFFTNVMIKGLNADASEITANCFIEDICVEQLSKRNVYISILVIVEAVEPFAGYIEPFTEMLSEESDASRVTYFTQECIEDVFLLTDNKPNIGQIISVINETEILSIEIMSNCFKGKSGEGEFLSGKKAAVDVVVRQKLLYTSVNESEAVYGLENNIYRRVYIIVPQKYRGSEPEAYLKNDLIEVEAAILHSSARSNDKKSVIINVELIVDLKFTPTFRICYSSIDNKGISRLVLVYEDGSTSRLIANGDIQSFVSPLWSPSGDKIIYMSNTGEERFIIIQDVRTLHYTRIHVREDVILLKSFTWANDNNRIIFTGTKDGYKELFEVDTVLCTAKQLTRGNHIAESFRPIYFQLGNKIAYIRSVMQIRDIWILDMDEHSNTRITEEGFIHDFDLSFDDRIIVYVAGSDENNCTLCIREIGSSKGKVLIDRHVINAMKRVKFSPDGKYIALIGKVGSQSDLFILEVGTGQFVNVTNNTDLVQILNFYWNTESDSIFYSANHLGFYNIFSVDINSRRKVQITNTTSERIEFNYRQRIR